MFLIGYRSISLQSLSPAEAELPGAEVYVEAYVFRQRYFHIFFIPIFGVGQKWTMRKINGQYYDVPECLSPVLRSYSQGLRIMAFLYFRLIILVSLGLAVSIGLRLIERDVKSHAKINYEAAKKAGLKRIAAASRGDWIELKAFNKIAGINKITVLRVDSAGKDSLYLEAAENTVDSLGLLTDSLTDEPAKLFALLCDSRHGLRFALSKKSLQEAYKSYIDSLVPFHPEASEKGALCLVQGRHLLVKLMGVKTPPFGYFEAQQDCGLKADSAGYNARFTYYGEPLLFDSLVDHSKAHTWTTGQPLAPGTTLEPGQEFSIERKDAQPTDTCMYRMCFHGSDQKPIVVEFNDWLQAPAISITKNGVLQSGNAW